MEHCCVNYAITYDLSAKLITESRMNNIKVQLFVEQLLNLALVPVP